MHRAVRAISSCFYCLRIVSDVLSFPTRRSSDLDKERTAFFFVVVPEQMIILDTQKATQLSSKFDVPIAGYVVNRVLPAELAGQQIPPYLQNRLQSQNHYLEQIKQTFGDALVGSVPELERDVTGLPMIEKLAAIMYGDGRR